MPARDCGMIRTALIRAIAAASTTTMSSTVMTISMGSSHVGGSAGRTTRTAISPRVGKRVNQKNQW